MLLGKMAMNTTVTPLIKEPRVPKQLRYRPCAVVMGRTGAGKTTLFNNLCGTSHEAGAGEASVTRELFRNDVSCGQYPFSLIDTPGTDSSTETYKHAYLLRSALTSTEINTLFIVIEYDCRFDRLVDNYLDVAQPVCKHSNKVVVMISKWDESENQQRDFQQICQSFKECADIANIICYSKYSPNADVANVMYGCISNMEKETIQITDEEFLINFNVATIKRRIKKAFNEYLQQMKSKFTEYSEAVFAAIREASQEKDDILHMLIVEFKNEAEALLTDFRLKHGHDMNELESYTLYIELQKENIGFCDKFVENTVPLMSYDLFDKNDPRNLIKHCPQCGQVWWKVEGCDGTTTCGNRSFSNYFDMLTKPRWKFRLKRLNGKLRWDKTKEEPLLDMQKACDTSRGVGCGALWKWSDIPKVEEKLILELFKVKTIDEAKQMIKSEDFQNARRDYESTINASFYF